MKHELSCNERTTTYNASLILLFILLLIPFRTQTATLMGSQSQNEYPVGSWGLGVVVPENSELSDGTRLGWSNAATVSATIQLPNISFADYPTLAVESLMAADGSVMQVAAAIYPSSTKWLAYGWYITNVQSFQQNYSWVLNSSKPQMSPGDTVTLTIGWQQPDWRYRITDLTSNVTATGDYAFSVPAALKVGDQEVFALESYSTASAVFAHMGNLTLEQLTVNGKRIVAGWYAYGSWNPHHNPLFVVGVLDPPFFVSLLEAKDSTLVWGYEEWSGSAATPAISPPLIIFVLILVSVVVAVIAMMYFTKRRTKLSE